MEININKTTTLMTLDIRDLYVNIPIKEMLHITETILQNNNTEKELAQQIILLLNIILNRTYFQYHNNFHQPNKGVSIESPISSTIAEIFLQYHEELILTYAGNENRNLL
jgi:hypothetical protein